jgi:putative transposase
LPEELPRNIARERTEKGHSGKTGVIKHPLDWKFCSLQEILNPRKRYGIIHHQHLLDLLKVNNYTIFKKQYVERLNLYIKENNLARKAKWSKSIAVGSKVFIEKIRKSLKTKVLKRKDVNHMDCYELREDQVLYDVLNEPENKFVWNP